MFVGSERSAEALSRTKVGDLALDLPGLDGRDDVVADDEVLARLQVDTMPLADVRAWLREVGAAHGWPAPLERTLALLTTELVANAQRHGPHRGRVGLTLVRTGRALRVEVQDEGARTPVVRNPPREAVNGRGMLLVQHFAQAWGSELLAHGGKTVWFTLAAEPS